MPGPLDAGDAAEPAGPAWASSALTSVSAGVARRRMDDEPGRLVDDQQVRVLVDDADRDLGRGREIERLGLRDDEPQRGPGPDHGVRLERQPVGGQVAGRDQLLDVAPRQTRDVGDVAVDALERGTRRDLERVDAGSRHRGGPGRPGARRRPRPRDPRRRPPSGVAALAAALAASSSAAAPPR